MSLQSQNLYYFVYNNNNKMYKELTIVQKT